MNFKPDLNIRTDMADEAHSLWKGRAEERGELSGVSTESFNLCGHEVTGIKILDNEAANKLGKACGQYYSLSLPQYFSRGSEDFPSIVSALSRLITRCAPEKFNNVLVAALGNPDITPDALGSLSASSLLITRHLDLKSFPHFNSLSLCRPGVLGCSGIESAQQVKLLCQLVRPQLVIIVDALAGSDTERLCRCIQVSDAGISPGSGVGNNREELSRDFLSIPVVSVGMPSVIDASFFGDSKFSGMFVTPRSIDESVRSAAKIIAYAINLAVHPRLSIGDLDALLS